MARTGRPRKGDVQIPVRVTEAMLDRVEALRAKLEKKTGVPLSRADVIRLALDKGIDALK